MNGRMVPEVDQFQDDIDLQMTCSIHLWVAIPDWDMFQRWALDLDLWTWGLVETYRISSQGTCSHESQVKPQKGCQKVTKFTWLVVWNMFYFYIY